MTRQKTGEVLAAKFEEANREKEIGGMLCNEAKLIHKLRSKANVPKLFFIGPENSIPDHPYNLMVMELLGPSLEDLFLKCRERFDLKTVLLIAIKLIQIIKQVHGEGIIHRDVKPNNFLLGLEEQKDTIYIIDFGLSKMFRLKDGDHIPFKSGKGMTGTARFASLATHNGEE